MLRGRANSFGVLRLIFALAVLLAHSSMLGYGKPFVGYIDMPGMAVAGFFGISGFLVTRSARRASLPRYLWHRALRILPGLWVCLLVTALVAAPAMWLYSGHPLAELFSSPDGPLNYLNSNFPAGHGSPGIAGLVMDTPYGVLSGFDVFNGSLWTLRYEIAGYLVLAVAAVAGVLRKQRWIVLAVAGVWFGALCWNYGAWLAGSDAIILKQGMLTFPGLGTFLAQWGMWYGFMFLAGGVFELYGDRIRLDGRIAAVAAAALAVFLYQGVLFGPGLLAYLYVILWLAAKLPPPLQRIGQTRDYSYGIYIYAFPVQQILAKYGATEWGLIGYTAITLVVTFVLAAASWHFVERQALKLKDWTPSLWLARVPRAVSAETAVRAAPAAPAVLAVPKIPAPLSGETPVPTPIPEGAAK